MQEYLEKTTEASIVRLSAHPRTYRSFHSTNVAARSLRTIMTRSTRSSRRSAEAPALADSIVEYRAHAGARSDAVPRLTVAISLNMIVQGMRKPQGTYLLRSVVTPPTASLFSTFFTDSILTGRSQDVCAVLNKRLPARGV